MNRDSLIKYRMQQLSQESSSYDFPSFLRAARRVHGLSRPQVSIELGVKQDRLSYLETGRFKRKVTSDELVMLSGYYGIENGLLKSLADAYLAHGSSEEDCS